MLSISDVPENIEALYKTYKDISREIFCHFEPDFPSVQIPTNTNILEQTSEGMIVFIVEGYFKLFHQNKVIRLFSEGDFIVADAGFEDYKITSEFAGEAVFIDKKYFLKKLKKAKGLLEQWLTLRSIENSIHIALCSFQMEEDVDAKFEFKQFTDGEIITNEGAAPNEIYEMISGEAIAKRDGQEIGRINTGEIFGEISFLTDSARTATVVAVSNCFVRVVKKEVFFDLIERNPHLIITISKTLASRIIQLNDKLVSQSV